MGERVPVNDLLPGDWVIEVAGRSYEEEVRIASVTHGFIDEAGRGEWGVTLEDGSARYLKGHVNQFTAYRATQEEAQLLDLRAEGDRVQRRAERDQARALRAGQSGRNERLIRRLLGRMR